MELYVCKFEYPWDLGYYKLGLSKQDQDLFIFYDSIKNLTVPNDYTIAI